MDATSTEVADDWKFFIPGHPPSGSKLSTPTFVRLFVMGRILNRYISENASNVETNDVIRSLVSFFNHKTYEQNAALTILSNLINNGIKKYMISMNQSNDDETICAIIEQILNKLILTKFGDEYASIITYNHNYVPDHDNKNYQSMVFNTKDVMCLIFQFLKWNTRNPN